MYQDEKKFALESAIAWVSLHPGQEVDNDMGWLNTTIFACFFMINRFPYQVLWET